MSLDKLDTLIALVTVLLGLSLLITILNQMVSSLLGHRGAYLKRGIIDLLGTLNPNLVPHAEELAKEVLMHKLASDSIFSHIPWGPTWWKMATTIHPEELSKLLAAVAKGKSYEAEVTAILNQINPDLAREAQILANTANTLAPGAAATADQFLNQMADKAAKTVGRLEAAFEDVLTRVTQRFTLQMRIWTVVFSLFFCLLYHLDITKIYATLAADPALQASVSNVSADLMKAYTTYQPPAPSKEVKPKPVTEPRPAAKQKAGGKKAAGKQKAVEAPKPEPETTAAETAGGEKAAAAVDPAKKLDEDSARLAKAYQEVRSKIGDPKLQLFEVPEDWTNFGGMGGLLRVLATAALLSLGAPFWYNALKGLTSLRSAVAQKGEKK